MDDRCDTTRRAAITGIGVISPIGCSTDDFWQSLVEGRSGISSVESPSQPDEPLACAGQVPEFAGRISDFEGLAPDVKKRLRKSLKVMNRETLLAVGAAQQSLADSGLSTCDMDPERIGVAFGTGNVPIMPEDFIEGVQACGDGADEFDFGRWGTDGIPNVAPLWILTCLPNMPACHVAICNDLRGPNNSITQREVAANLAVAEAWHGVSEGAADAMVVGATGTTMLPRNAVRVLMQDEIAPASNDPTAMSRPFDQRRCGYVVAEGAAAIVLEEYESAVSRGARIYGEVIGAGSSCVLDRSYAPHNDTALTNAMHMALRAGNLTPGDIDHIHCHGLSTRRSDVEEARAIRQIFGRRADTVPVVAAKSSLGNAGAGAGALELVASLLAVQHGRLFPVLNYEEPDPDCPINPAVSADVEAGRCFLNLSMAPYGQASCLAVRAAA